MILAENIPIFYSIGSVVAIAAGIFVWRFYVFRRNSLENLISTPSIVVTGMKFSGKSSLIRMITGDVISMNPVVDSQTSYLQVGNQKIQFLELPAMDGLTDGYHNFKKINVKSLIFVFDVSKKSPLMEKQVETFESMKNLFGVPYIVVANKLDLADRRKLDILEKKFEKIHEISSLGKYLTRTTDYDSLKKESEDVSKLMHDILNEINMLEDGKPQRA
jgi:GTP1/Obg family GTP-binding protein